MAFASRIINTWGEFVKTSLGFEDKWVFRGQATDSPLSTSLERVCEEWDIPASETPAIEQQLIREFRRHYHGPDVLLVRSDTLYCMSVMQHHGAPTRLLDWTYSPFIAAKFAIERGAKEAVVWCVNTGWCQSEAKRIAGTPIIDKRNADSRNDTSFLKLYICDRKHFVFPENPYSLNERLIIQKGLFMCPGDVADTFCGNLEAMEDWSSSSNIVKLVFDMDVDERHKFALTLLRMNVSSDVLFPGIDGFARSLRDRILLMRRFAKRKAGSSHYKGPT
jgi:hypothetical protein